LPATKRKLQFGAAVLNYMLTYMNTTISNFKLKRDYPDKPEDFPKKSMVRQNTKLWYKVT
jgi:hypothetical protein